MFLLLVATVLLCIVHCSDKYCAWNRAVTPIKENNAGTYNFLNGEFNRWYGFYTGDLWHGQPYYRSEPQTCFVTNLYMYRFGDVSDTPPVYTWVIGPNLGSPPNYGYAYCTAAQNQQSAPYGGCDGQWKIGVPGTDAHVLDNYFKVQQGGCPQVTCESMEFGGADDWAGTYNYVSPNIYRQTGVKAAETSTTDEWYLYFNPRVWRWAIHEHTNDYELCEYYKQGKGFVSVANVIEGDATKSMIPGYNGKKLYFVPSTGDHRTVTCVGVRQTPAPVAATPLVPTHAPVIATADMCKTQWQKVSILKLQEIIERCGCTYSLQQTGQCSTSPTYANAVLTASPVPAGQPAAQPAYNAIPTPQPASQPGSQPASNPTPPPAPAPTSPGTAEPTGPTTAAPTDQFGTAKPTGPTTARPTSRGTAKPTNPPNDSDDACRFNAKVYVLGIVLFAVYALF